MESDTLGDPWIALSSTISVPLPEPVTPSRLRLAIERREPQDHLILKRLLEDGNPVDILRIHRHSRRKTTHFLKELAIMLPGQSRHVRRIANALDIDFDLP